LKFNLDKLVEGRVFRVQGLMFNPVLGAFRNLEPVGKGRVYVYSLKYP
jgi:hypothetical protein